MPVFSYAQAAKGLTTASNPKPESVPEESDAVQSTADTVDASTTASTAAKEDNSVSGGTPSGTSESECESAPAADLLKDLPETIPELAEPAKDVVDEQEEKEKEEKEDKEKEEKEEEEDKKEKAPVVNVWQQRREAQEAKAKANALLKPVPAATAAATTPVSSAPAPSKAGPAPAADVRSEPYKQARKKDDKKKPEGVKKRRDEALPPVNDASSWPTPQIAQGEDRKAHDPDHSKLDKADKEKPSRAHGKEKWMPVPYVPTAVFNTPLPPAAARRGGRSARGGSRDGTSSSRGGHSAATPASKTADKEKEKEKDVEPATTTAAAAAAATAAKGDSLKNGDPAEAQKDVKDAGSNTAPVDANQHAHPVSQSPTRARQEQPKSYHKSHSHSHESSNPSSSSYKGGDHSSRQAASSSADAAHGHGHARYGVSHDRRFDSSNPRSGEFSSYAPRDRDFRDGRDYRESRSERGGRGGYRGRGGHSSSTTNNTSTTYSASTSTSPSTAAPATTTTTPSTAGSTAQNPPYHSAPITQHQFTASSKTYSPFPDRHRLPTTANGTTPSSGATGNRMTIRSPSMPGSASGPSSAIQPMYQMPFIQTDLNLNLVYPYQPTTAPPTIPYHPYAENFSVLSMISMQLEYYFSVDNLCKDLFLRKHMDSQGFVLLSFIAAFKRIKSLTEDMELLRFACRQLRNVEYRSGEDGVDRLRKREGWAQWVLSMEMRDVSAQNEGPKEEYHHPHPHHQQQQQQMHQQQQHAHVNGSGSGNVNGLGNGHGYTSYMPAEMEEAPKKGAGKLSSAAPEFSPLGGNTFDQGAFTDGTVDYVPMQVGQ